MPNLTRASPNCSTNVSIVWSSTTGWWICVSFATSWDSCRSVGSSERSKITKRTESGYSNTSTRKYSRRRSTFLECLQEDHSNLDQAVRSHNSHQVSIPSWNLARIQVNREGLLTIVKIVHARSIESVNTIKAPASND